MTTATLVRPLKIEQVAALMLTVFQANPNTVMTRREIESMLDLNLDGLSAGSTRRGALNYLCTQGHICCESPYWHLGGGGQPVTYWLSTEKKDA
jgi:hypothetical protein